MRRLVPLLALLLTGCTRPASAPKTESPTPAPTESHTSADGTLTSPPAQELQPVAATPASMAKQRGLLFRRVGEQCEVWHFGDDGLSTTVPFRDRAAEAKARAAMSEWQRQRADTIAKKRPRARPEARLAFSYEIVGEEVVVADPTVTVAGLSETVACEPAAGGGWYMEESDCLAQGGGAASLGGCADAFADAAVQAAFGTLTQAIAARKAKAAEEAKARLKAFQRKLPSGASVYWQTALEGQVSCEKWTRRRDSLVHRTRGGGRSSYGYSTQLNRYRPVAEVHLTGPHYSGPDGSAGVGHWDIQAITEVHDDHAVVGDKPWYFSRDACARADPP